MSMVYAHRGYETIEELLNVVEGFDAQVTEKLATELAAKAQVRRLSGGAVSAGLRPLKHLKSVLRMSTW
ncbi:hypothetical protein P4S64_06145 [Vibrio sp. M60_M31a]